MKDEDLVRISPGAAAVVVVVVVLMLLFGRGPAPHTHDGETIVLDGGVQRYSDCGEPLFDDVGDSVGEGTPIFDCECHQEGDLWACDTDCQAFRDWVVQVEPADTSCAGECRRGWKYEVSNGQLVCVCPERKPREKHCFEVNCRQDAPTACDACWAQNRVRTCFPEDDNCWAGVCEKECHVTCKTFCVRGWYED